MCPSSLANMSSEYIQKPSLAILQRYQNTANRLWWHTRVHSQQWAMAGMLCGNPAGDTWEVTGLQHSMVQCAVEIQLWINKRGRRPYFMARYAVW